MGKLTILEPLDITEAILTATNVAENDYAAWSAPRPTRWATG